MSSPTNHHEASLMYVIGRVNQGIRREMRTRLATWNLSVQEYTTLSVLEARPNLSNAQLARRALVTPQSMIEMLAKLEVRGLLKRTSDPSNRLIRRVELTPKGRALLREADPAIHAIHDEMVASVSVESQEAVMKALLIAMDNLSRH